MVGHNGQDGYGSHDSHDVGNEGLEKGRCGGWCLTVSSRRLTDAPISR